MRRPLIGAYERMRTGPAGFADGERENDRVVAMGEVAQPFT